MNTRSSILIVDDEVAITDMLAAFLARSGYAVEVAANGEEALRQIAKSKPDLLVLDVLMPRLDGREVLRQLRQSGDWMPVILLTQVGEATERAMAIEEGTDDYINKPFNPYELIARIRAVLRISFSATTPAFLSFPLQAKNIDDEPPFGFRQSNH